jgi:hypothetical protein
VVGLQATDLLIAVHLAFGPIEKEAEVALIPKERPVRTSLISSSTLVSSGSGHRFITVDSVDSTDAICPPHFGVVGRMSILGWARDCWKPRRFYRDIHSRGSMHTKVMRSVSSEDIRSEARRAIRTREGKDCH